MSLRNAVRAVTPKALRLAVAQVRRAGRDSGLQGPRPRFAAKSGSSSSTGFEHCVLEIVQVSQALRVYKNLDDLLAELREQSGQDGHDPAVLQ